MFPGSGRSHREGHGNSLQYLSFSSWLIHLVWILVIAKYSSIQLLLNANLVIDYLVISSCIHGPANVIVYFFLMAA